jgi:uncharacterized lipoprotein YddW (UPF0748 family)
MIRAPGFRSRALSRGCLAVLLLAAVCGAQAAGIRAVWDQKGTGLYPGDWPRTFRLLKAAGMTDLFVTAGGVDFAHYATRLAPPSRACRLYGDQMSACLSAARGTGIRVHAWVLCFNATRPTPEQQQTFARKGWYLKDPGGKTLTYLDPSNPDLRWTLLKIAEELARRYPLVGIHLDFVRWYERTDAAWATPAVRARFRSEVKQATEAAFPAWRTAKIASFVSAARGRVKAARPSAWLTVAVLGKYPSCVAAVGQDWQAWLNAGLIDYIVPMNYTDDYSKYVSFVAVQARKPAHARQTISGIGITANGLSLTPQAVAAQTRAAEKAGLAGAAYFDLDERFLTLFKNSPRLFR